MNDINPSTGSMPSASPKGRAHRLSSPSIAIIVIGSVLAAGAVGAVIGGTSKTRTPASNEVPLPDSADLQPIPVDRSSLGQPTGGSSLGLGSGGSIQGGLSFSAQAFTAGAFTDQGTTATTRLTTLTLAPRPRPGTNTTISQTTRPPGQTTKPTTRPRVVTTTTEAPPDTEAPLDTQAPLDTEAPVFESVTTQPPLRRVTTTTRPQRQQQAHQLGGGLVIVPSAGYKIVKKFDSGEVVIGNDISFVHAWVNEGIDTNNFPATQVVDYLTSNFLQKAFEGVQADPAVAIKPSKRSITSMASTSYQGLIAGDQGSTAIEGIVFVAERQDGLTLTYIATWVQGSWEKVKAGPR